MSVKYALFKNHLTPNPNDYTAVVQGNDSRTEEDVIDVMIGRGSTVTKAESLSVSEEKAAAIEDMLKQGYSINTPLFNVSISISGIFNGEDDRFDPERHQVKLNLTPGTRLKAITSQIAVERVSANKILPILRTFTDENSNTINANLSPGGAGQLSGDRLKVEMEDPKQGLFFVADDGTTTRTTQIIRNKPSELIFMIPSSLAPGTYRLEVRTIFSGNTDIRIGLLEAPLSVKTTRAAK